MQRYFGIGKNENKIILESSDLHHIKNVMRMKNKDQIEVVLKQELFLCEIEIEHDTVSIYVKEKMNLKDDFMKQVVLIIPILKEQKMDFVLQKATELGVSEIIPVQMKRCVAKVELEKMEKKLERWNRIIKEASEQSMRYIVPNLKPITTIKEMGKLDGLKMICSTTENKKSVKNFLQSNKNYDKLIIVIGPEGGIDSSEEDYLQEIGFEPVTLGPRIMRVETVPIYLLSVLNYEYME